MDGLYQSPPYTYLPQQQNTNVDNYHLYRSNNSYQHHHSMDNWSPHHHNHPPAYNYYGSTNNNTSAIPSPRPKITTNIWEDEGTLCFQVDAKGICVARRQDNDMINGTKLLNVVGMSRGKRDGILKNEKGRVVVKVGAMHLKGVWIPFSRATELAEKFKILDVLYPLFVEEPSIYLCNPIGSGAHNSDVIPSVTNKCNMVSSPLPAFNNRQSSSDEYSPSIPNWDNRPSYLMNQSPSHYDHALNRNHHHHHHHHSSSDENDMYLLNNNQFNNHNNRGSFSSVSSHQSYLYPSLHHEDDTSKTSSVTTPTSYVDQIYNHTSYGASRTFNQEKTIYTASSPYIKSSPYTNTAPASAADHRNSSAGSTTPSSWFSPETPTAVLFQQKEEVGSKRRKTSTCSLDSKSIQKSSPIDRATRRLKIEQD